MKDSDLRTRAKAFALKIIAVCDTVDTKKGKGALVSQIVKSATSIGANIHEANYASSKADFINKFQIALKECYETDYWLGLFKDTHMITTTEYDSLYGQCSKIRKLLISSITTAKSNMEQKEK